MRSVFDRHTKAALFFSAGKDSLALLHLLRDEWDRLDVVWANPGAAHPEVVEYMRGIRALVPHFVEVQGNQPTWVREHGWPADVVPSRATSAGEIGSGFAPIKFQSYMSCCAANMWGPMDRYVRENCVDLVIMGQRKAESLRNRLRDATYSVLDGRAYWNPINEWSDARVYDFLSDQGLELPPFYKEGATSSADCWNCTAYLDHNAGRLAHMRAADPDRFAQVHVVLSQLHGLIRQETQPLERILKGEVHES